MIRKVFRLFSAAWLVFVLIAAVGGGLWWRDLSHAQDLDHRFAPPFSESHILGTDDLGRDVLLRSILGSQTALMVLTVSVLPALLIGLMLGAAGARRSFPLHQVLTIIMDVILSVPTVLLCLVAAAAFGHGLLPTLLCMLIVFIPPVYRMTSDNLSNLQMEYYTDAARIAGASGTRILLFYHVPLIIPGLLSQGLSLWAIGIAVEASLSYLGFGVQAPDASWGSLLKDAQSSWLTSPHLMLVPGFMLILTILTGSYWTESILGMRNPLYRSPASL